MSTKSLLQSDKKCFKCGSPYADLHHIRLGNCTRRRAEHHGMFVYLCRAHHRWLHDHPECKEELQRLAQKRFEETHSHEEYMKLFRKNYLKGDD